MASVVWIEHLVVSIILTIFSILSCIVLYQLFSGLYCAGFKTKESSASKRDASISPPSPDITVNSTNELSRSHSSRSNDQPAAQSIHKFFKRTTITTCSIFSILCFVANVDRTLSLLNPERTIGASLMLILPLYFLGRICLSSIFIGRLHYTFRGSVFEFSKCTMNSLKCTWGFMVFCAVLSVLLSVSPTIRLIGMMFGTSMVLIDIVLSLVLLFFYSKKLYLLAFAHDDFFLSIMTKYSVLYAWCFSSTFAVFLMTSIQVTSAGSSFGADEVILFLSIDALVNCTCLWLNLIFANEYYVIICSRCDNQCTTCCRWCTKGSKNQNMMKKEVAASAVAVQIVGKAEGVPSKSGTTK